MRTSDAARGAKKSITVYGGSCATVAASRERTEVAEAKRIARVFLDRSVVVSCGAEEAMVDCGRFHLILQRCERLKYKRRRR
jgi:hypothetical protein